MLGENMKEREGSTLSVGSDYPRICNEISRKVKGKMQGGRLVCGAAASTEPATCNTKGTVENEGKRRIVRGRIEARYICRCDMQQETSIICPRLSIHIYGNCLNPLPLRLVTIHKPPKTVVSEITLKLPLPLCPAPPASTRTNQFIIPQRWINIRCPFHSRTRIIRP